MCFCTLHIYTWTLRDGTDSKILSKFQKLVQLVQWCKWCTIQSRRVTTDWLISTHCASQLVFYAQKCWGWGASNWASLGPQFQDQIKALIVLLLMGLHHVVCSFQLEPLSHMPVTWPMDISSLPWTRKIQLLPAVHQSPRNQRTFTALPHCHMTFLCHELHVTIGNINQFLDVPGSQCRKGYLNTLETSSKAQHCAWSSPSFQTLPPADSRCEWHIWRWGDEACLGAGHSAVGHSPSCCPSPVAVKNRWRSDIEFLCLETLGDTWRKFRDKNLMLQLMEGLQMVCRECTNLSWNLPRRCNQSC